LRVEVPVKAAGMRSGKAVQNSRKQTVVTYH
jgi:hypothetical protein